MQPKKSLGQNFLKDSVVLKKIIEAADLKPDDFVIEIGPGEGVLTEKLTKKAGRVIAIEKDNNLASRLDSRLRGNDKIKIINDDILKINLPELISSYKLKARSYKLISNIPYYITSPIIKLFLETIYPPTEMILMVQKEVAERIVEKPGNMSILAVSVQYYAKAELLFYVDKKSFWPVPEVDSAVIKITPNKSNLTLPSPSKGEGDIEKKQFFRIVHAGFAARRKTLLNNLSNSLHIERAETEEKIKKAGIDPGARAQELSVDDWKKLTKIIF